MKHNFHSERIVYNIQVLCRRYIGSYMVPSKEITQRTLQFGISFVIEMKQYCALIIFWYKY